MYQIGSMLFLGCRRNTSITKMGSWCFCVKRRLIIKRLLIQSLVQKLLTTTSNLETFLLECLVNLKCSLYYIRNHYIVFEIVWLNGSIQQTEYNMRNGYIYQELVKVHMKWDKSGQSLFFFLWTMWNISFKINHIVSCLLVWLTSRRHVTK